MIRWCAHLHLTYIYSLSVIGLRLYRFFKEMDALEPFLQPFRYYTLTPCFFSPSMPPRISSLLSASMTMNTARVSYIPLQKE